jgi:ATP synthase protein I
LSDTPPSERGTKRTERLAELDRRIKAAREAGEPEPRSGKEKYAAMSLGWRMVIELVLSVMIGAAMGWGLDRLLGSLPLFLIVFVMLGFAAGVRTMLRTATEMQSKGAEPADDERA